MKARVKATGKLVEVHPCDDADFVDMEGNYYWEHQLFFGSLDTFPYEDPDYWTRLEHQYAGMFLQAQISYGEQEDLNTEEMVEDAMIYAHTLVEKMKNQSV